MSQWINDLHNEVFVNPMRLPLLYKKTGSVAIVELGRMAGRLLGMLSDRRNCCKVRKFKFCIFDF